MRVVDLRSDTVTSPTPEMRQSMAMAEVGDDVYRECPSTIRLEEMAADITGKDAALFVPSGTMGNLVAILAHSQRGHEIIIGDKSHIFRSEAGGASALGGVSYNTIPNDDRGMLDPNKVEDAIRDDNNLHHPRTSMIALENTHNFCGGYALTAEDTEIISQVCRRHDIPLHIDGARIFNAEVYLETPTKKLVSNADSVNFCLSKGLGAPVGSVVCGSHKFIDEARRWRKMLGAGMRQVGVLAAAGIVALDTMVQRLAEDHTNARKLALGLSTMPNISIDPSVIQTNLVFFEVNASDPANIARRLTDRGVKGGSPNRRWRFVTHADIDGDDIDYALDIIESTLKETTA